MLGSGCEVAAVEALSEFPQGLQIGGNDMCHIAENTDVNHSFELQFQQISDVSNAI